MKSLAGTWPLVRLALRRDRVRIPVWIVAIAGFVVLTVAGFPGLYETAAERQARAEIMSNPATKALAGPGYGLEDYTFGAMTANEMLPFAAIFTALMSVLLVVRHTRAEEASGSAELVRANVVGRHANSAAAIIVVGSANIVLGGVMALGLGVIGVESVTWSSSLLAGAMLAAIGFAFMAIGLLAAQITTYARAAAGLAGAAIAAFYLIRGVGDISNGTLTWLSPFGWTQATQVYVNDRWWPLLLVVGLTVVCIAASLALSTRRDVGAGLMQPKPGPAQARAGLASADGLARRLQRGSLAWWTAGLVLWGALYGSLVSEFERFVAEAGFADSFLPAVTEGVLVDSFTALILSMMGMVVAIYAIITVQRLRSEETAGRAEPVLAAAVSRGRWALSHFAIALAGSVVLLIAGGLGFGASAAISLGDPSVLASSLGASLAYVPAVWLTAGLTLALFGLLPRLLAIVWIVPIYGLVVGILGGLLGFPGWLNNLSPFAHIPAVPAESMSAAPLAVLTAATMAAAAAGFAAIRRRNINTS